VANLTTIVANLALARSVNYDHKVRCKLKRTFTIINYNPKPFIAQNTGNGNDKKIFFLMTNKTHFGIASDFKI